MKRALAILLPLLLFALLPLATSATSPEEYLATLYDSLPALSRDALPSDPADTEALLETVGVRHLVSVLLSGIEGATPALVRTLLTLMGLTLLFALLALLREGLGSAARVADAALGCVLVLVIYDRFSGLFERAAAYLADLCTLAEVSAPVMGGLYLAGGNTASAAVAGGGMAALSLLLELLSGRALLPLLRVMLGFLLVSAIGEVKTEGLTASLRTLFVTLLGFFSVLVMAAQALGHAIGSASDTLTLRTMRFALGQMIPIVGGTVAGSLGTAMASVALVRSTAGVTVAAAILLPLLPLLAELILSRMVLSLAGTVAGLLGAAAPVRLLRSFRSLFDLVLAAVAFAGLLFLFLAATLARTVPALL